MGARIESVCTARNATKRLHHRCSFIRSTCWKHTRCSKNLSSNNNNNNEKNASKFNMSEHNVHDDLGNIAKVNPMNKKPRQHFDFCLCFYSPLDSTNERLQTNPPKEKLPRNNTTQRRKRRINMRRKNKTSLFCCVYASFSCFAFYWVLLTRCKSFK